MNDEEGKILFSTQEMLVCVKQERGKYYFSVAEQEVRGPFLDEVEAYQEAMREMGQYFESVYQNQVKIRESLKIILTPVKDLLEAFRLEEDLNA